MLGVNLSWIVICSCLKNYAASEVCYAEDFIANLS